MSEYSIDQNPIPLQEVILSMVFFSQNHQPLGIILDGLFAWKLL